MLVISIKTGTYIKSPEKEPKESNLTHQIGKMEITSSSTPSLVSRDISIPSMIEGILQGEAGITNANASKPIIASFGATSCVIVAFYQPSLQTAALAHIDPSSDLNGAIGDLVEELPGEKNDSILIEMSSENIKNNKTLEDLQSIIKNNARLKLKKVHESSCLSIDARSGVVSNEPIRLPPTIDLENRMVALEDRMLEAWCYIEGQDEMFRPQQKIVFDFRNLSSNA